MGSTPTTGTINMYANLDGKTAVWVGVYFCYEFAYNLFQIVDPVIKGIIKTGDKG